MNPKLQKYLFEKYPKIFKLHNDKTSCISRGIEHGDGWFAILDSLCSNIQCYIDNPNYIEKKGIGESLKQLWNKIGYNKIIYHLLKKLDEPERRRLTPHFRFFSPKWYPPVTPTPQVEFMQVKEKFGTLRIYATNTDTYISGLISMAESMSGNTCEICGTTKKVGTTKGWTRHLCENCSDKPVFFEKGIKPLYNSVKIVGKKKLLNG